MLPRIVGVLMDALHLHFMMQRMSSYLCCAAAVGGLETSCALQMLAYMQLMLQQLPNCRPLQHYEAAAGEGSCTMINFRALWELLLLLALKQDHAAVRWKSGLLQLTKCWLHDLTLHAAPDSC
jgi:hypothetical protein